MVMCVSLALFLTDNILKKQVEQYMRMDCIMIQQQEEMGGNIESFQWMADSL